MHLLIITAALDRAFTAAHQVLSGVLCYCRSFSLNGVEKKCEIMSHLLFSGVSRCERSFDHCQFTAFIFSSKVIKILGVLRSFGWLAWLRVSRIGFVLFEQGD